MASSSSPNSTPTWDPSVVADFITAPRLSSYLRAANGDLATALALYEWNSHADAALVQTAALVEAVVRNALDRELTNWADERYGDSSWFDAAPVDQRGRAVLTDARHRATRNGRRPEVHGKVVAELSFGFWRVLAASKYHANLWVPALHRAFPNGDADLRRRRVDVEQVLTRIGNARNRGAHHEPVHGRDLRHDLQRAVTVASWVSPDTGAWVEAISTIPAVISERASLEV